MRFLLDDEQREFRRSLDALLKGADTPAVVRAWSVGDHTPGRALWGRLAEAGVLGLSVPEEHDGLGFLPVELAVACTELGRHAVPGPVVETLAAAALLDRLGDQHTNRLPGMAAGKTVATLRPPGDDSPYALDADMADLVLVVTGDTLRAAESTGPVQPSVDPARRLFRPTGGAVLAEGPRVRRAAAHAADVARLAAAAQALGVGRTLLDRTVAHVRERHQFGRPVGSFQAIKHRLADVLISLEFTEPLVHAAALSLASAAADSGRDIAAAKAAAGDAVHLAARTALQCHGAVGYTVELDLSLWIRKAHALRTAWGTPTACRARVLTT
ncbi:acyl-CoA dehydrogenase family protein [Streptomyces griseorubiginosus]|uniref:acyl-CoA dehydrogenase family protein n=1 Tax=Streptomyces griseorubiginosus TaxID=67304 RepID=UPI00113FECC9|nr:acyl-CoA dehydrogenase family protein [Streptomyces griseorubiginosus]